MNFFILGNSVSDLKIVQGLIPDGLVGYDFKAFIEVICGRGGITSRP